MKNVHLLSTDKPSRLFYDISLDKLILATAAEVSKWFDNKHIYITSSDEEIKEGDYGLDTFHKETRKFRNKNFVTKYDKKIILTTDQDLIKDGVQAIDDEFLEWFVKNLSCEWIKVETIPNSSWGFDMDEPMVLGYKIIIPQEESKLINNCPKCGLDLIEREGSTPVCHRVDCGGIILSNETLREWALKKEPKQETPEEAAQKQWGNVHSRTGVLGFIDFIEGAKWQAEKDRLVVGLLQIELNHTKTLLASCEKALEDRDSQTKRMYSEEEVIEFGEIIAWNIVGKTVTESSIRTILKECFNQYKKQK